MVENYLAYVATTCLLFVGHYTYSVQMWGRRGYLVWTWLGTQIVGSLGISRVACGGLTSSVETLLAYDTQ